MENRFFYLVETSLFIEYDANRMPYWDNMKWTDIINKMQYDDIKNLLICMPIGVLVLLRLLHTYLKLLVSLKKFSFE